MFWFFVVFRKRTRWRMKAIKNPRTVQERGLIDREYERPRPK